MKTSSTIQDSTLQEVWKGGFVVIPRRTLARHQRLIGPGRRPANRRNPKDTKQHSRFEAWHDLLAAMCWTSGVVVGRPGHERVLGRGDVRLGIEYWGDRWNWTNDAVRNWFKRLAGHGLIERRPRRAVTGIRKNAPTKTPTKAAVARLVREDAVGVASLCPIYAFPPKAEEIDDWQKGGQAKRHQPEDQESNTLEANTSSPGADEVKTGDKSNGKVLLASCPRMDAGTTAAAPAGKAVDYGGAETSAGLAATRMVSKAHH